MADIAKIEYSGEVYDIADQTARNSIGDLATLSTTEKTNLVDALNEVAAGAGGGDWNPQTFNFPAVTQNGITLRATTAYCSEHFIDTRIIEESSFSPVVDNSHSAVSQIVGSADVLSFMRSVWGDDVGTSGGKNSFSAFLSIIARVGEPGIESFCLVDVTISFTATTSGTASASLTVNFTPIVVMSPGTYAGGGIDKKLRLPVFDF